MKFVYLLNTLLKLLLGSHLLVCKIAAFNTLWGSTGLIQVPTTTITRANETSASSYLSFGGGDTYLGLNFNMAFSDHLELALADTVGWDERAGSSTLLSLKYAPMDNLAVGGMFDTNSQFQHSVYAVMGSPKNSVYLGLGAIFGVITLTGSGLTSLIDLSSSVVLLY